MVTSKVGMAKSVHSPSVWLLDMLTLLYTESNDPEFDEYNRKFTAMEGAIEKLLKDTKVYTENVTSAHFPMITLIINLIYFLQKCSPPVSSGLFTLPISSIQFLESSTSLRNIPSRRILFATWTSSRVPWRSSGKRCLPSWNSFREKFKLQLRSSKVS